MSKHKRHYISFDKLSVGYEDFLDVYTTLEAEFSKLPYYPPFNIKKIDEDSYVLELSVPGYAKEDLKVSLSGEVLTVEAAGQPQSEEDLDDEYFYQGIYPGGEIKSKFLVSPRLSVEKAEYADGVLEIHFLTTVSKDELSVPVGPFVKDVKPYVVEYDSTGAPVNVYEEIVTEDLPPVETNVLVNDHTELAPTTDVILPEVLPQIVEVSLDHVAETVDPTSADPQATLVVTPATYEVVADDVHTEVIKTADGASDIVVAVPAEVKAELDALGIDPVADIKAAIEKSDAVLPAAVEPEVGGDTTVAVTTDAGEPKVDVVVPDSIPQIVEVKVETQPVEFDAAGAPTLELQPIVTLEPVAHDIPETHELIPVVTAEGEPDIVIAISPEDKAVLEDRGVDVAADISTAVVEAVPVIEVSTPVLEHVAEDVPAPVEVPVVEPVAEVVPDPVVEVLPEPVVEVVPEPVAEAPVEVLPEPVVETVEVPVEAPVEPVEAPTAELPAELPLELPVAEVAVEAPVEPVAEVVAEPVVEAAPVAEELLPEVVHESVAVHEETDAVPTVEVLVPEVLPQIIEISADHVAETVEPATAEPQATLVLNDATHEVVSDDVYTEVIKTEEGKADVVVAIPVELKTELESKGIDVMADVADAIDKSSAVAPELVVPPAETTDVTVSVVDAEQQPKLEVTTADVVAPVLELKVTESLNEGVPAVSLEDVSHDIPETHEMIPVVTGEGQPDVIVAVAPEVKAELEAQGVDISTDVSAALVEGDIKVATPETVDDGTTSDAVPEQTVE